MKSNKKFSQAKSLYDLCAPAIVSFFSIENTFRFPSLGLISVATFI